MRNKSKKKSAQLARAKPALSKAIPFLLHRLFVFNISSVALCLLAGIVLLSRLEEASRRTALLPAWFVWTFIAVWISSTSYRFYLSATQNHKLSQIATNEVDLRRYAGSQVYSTLVSLVLATSAVLYLSGLLQPIAEIVARFLKNLNAEVVGGIISVFGTVFWGVVSCAVWDLVKMLYGRSTASKRASIRKK